MVIMDLKNIKRVVVNKEERRVLIKALQYANDIEAAYLDVVKEAMGASHHLQALNFLQEYDTYGFVADFGILNDKVTEEEEASRVWKEKQRKEKKDEK